MSRKARPPIAQLPRIRQELKEFLVRSGTTPTAFARGHGLNQSTLQRFLAGDTKTITPRMRPLLMHAGIDVDMRMQRQLPVAAEHPRIRKALERIWDGRDQTAEILATLIEAVGPVIQQSLPPVPGAAGTGASQ